ncbi:hypothetical protein FGM00_07100 [Aggregatimonas sangjinii]|uniref:DUF3592 domain-containing protein n=1 Tax=Aggregatimonas sangjinii TaxID=2583587 RepID=A0A5B7SMY7_9FLAO|nr:DUF3592 domain-containing protein [Aggregatimonas sangjinii]QCW99876.1 hypothetical protein FGM00_07100 [Aggregatimonas sangjinii]
MKQILILTLFIAPSLLFAQQNTENWIETEAKILEVHNKIKAKSTRAFATISFTANDGNQYESQVELLAIPLFGTTKSVGDSVSILYNPETPILAKSVGTGFLEQYGLYLLIGAGILFSFTRLKKAYTSKNSAD